LQKTEDAVRSPEIKLQTGRLDENTCYCSFVFLPSLFASGISRLSFYGDLAIPSLFLFDLLIFS